MKMTFWIIQTVLRKLATSSKTAKFDPFQTFRTLKNDLSSYPSFDSLLVPSLGKNRYFLHK